jgi:hypothetical protein
MIDDCRLKKKSIRTGMVDRVRAACKTFKKPGWFTRMEVFFEVDPELGQECRSFERTWQDLIGRGELVKVHADKKIYRYNKSTAPVSKVREKTLRAMHIKGAFCAADIKKLTDGDQSYISAVIRKLAKAGDLELTGKVGKTKMYRVKNSSKFYLEKVMG